MYEYLADLERWKKYDNDYTEKYSKVILFTNDCQSNCKTKKTSQEEIISCFNLCKKPIVDIERHNTEINKRLTSDIYELCTKKALDISDINKKISKIKMCSENLYRDNEQIVKKEIINRVDDIINFLKV